ncbi:hypothetical protein H6F50_04595 [Coleofasciculus sp. FACHB-712]|uniref:hypothetical protein n=1 Tax=Coleofasciculus sp. FACHB-712 TaxID=2692789 RepID=UPI0016866652|nr:hypothetical protein [Coleofasciculus sp. FACHB-712]MBD1941641.1 hypothetical protein [Coleofasciculus sp. FACHB-712]
MRLGSKGTAIDLSDTGAVVLQSFTNVYNDSANRQVQQYIWALYLCNPALFRVI